mmetsp:Transcript_5401/g.9525  ORF Transcript_5401/g.9525 Transcript_5401/m.9525 type:complete len:94 (-) Transcript_5401:520-801(-)
MPSMTDMWRVVEMTILTITAIITTHLLWEKYARPAVACRMLLAADGPLGRDRTKTIYTVRPILNRGVRQMIGMAPTGFAGATAGTGPNTLVIL